MSEKVYGICGTNKCRKEVVAKENILIYKIKMPRNGTTATSVFFPKMEDSEKQKFIMLSKAVSVNPYMVAEYDADYNNKISIDLYDDSFVCRRIDSADITLFVTVVVLCFNDNDISLISPR